MGEIQQQDVSSSSWVMRLRSGGKLAQACVPLLGEAFQRLCISSTTTLCVLVPWSMLLAQLGTWTPWKQCCARGGMGSVHRVCLLHTRLTAVCAFVFIVPRIFFLPHRLPLALRCSAHLLSLREEQERLCYLSLFHFVPVVLEFRPQKAGGGLLFQHNHMGCASSLV